MHFEPLTRDSRMNSVEISIYKNPISLVKTNNGKNDD
jgi:hypothetical protein